MIKKPTFVDWIDTDSLEQDKLAEGTFYNLTLDLGDFNLPEIPWDKLQIPQGIIDALSKNPEKVSVNQLTSRVPKGDGVFDALMESCSNHLKEESISGRITGAEYTKAYVQCFAVAMQSAVQFLTSQDGLYWQSIAAQLAALKATIEFYTLMVQLYIAEINVYITKTQYAAGKISLAVSQEQIKKLKEEMEQLRAQTLDTRTDGLPVVGVVGKQKELYEQQSVAYQRNSEIKAVNLWMDGYSVNKTTDEGLEPPSNLTNANVDSVMSELKSRIFDQN